MVYVPGRTLCLSLVLGLIVIGTGAYFLIRYNSKDPFHRNAIVSNGKECAAIGMEILQKYDGTAVDAAIAVAFCEGVAVTQSMGLGGGFLATIYTKSSGSAETLVARERAPLAAHRMMFQNVTSLDGILSVAVPGELKGYGELHRKYGRVAWTKLIQPTIDLCRKGHLVTAYLHTVLKRKENVMLNTPALREVFINPQTGRTWKVGDRIKRIKLAESLEIIANEGPDTMYTANGTLAKLMIDEIQQLGGIITMEDLVRYETEWQKPITTKLKGDYTLHSISVPGSGMILAMILNIMNGYPAEYSVEYMHRLIEAFKFSYAQRTHLGDTNMNETLAKQIVDVDYANHVRSLIWDNQTFNDYKHYGGEFALTEDHGTAQISVLAANGDAVSLTSTINGILGSYVRLRSTGMILNNEMDDFSTPGKINDFGLPPSPANFIEPMSRPISSMCPFIVLDGNNDVVFVSGSAGGSKITSTVAYVFVNHVWLKKSLEEAVSSKRIHHQLMPMHVVYEKGFDSAIIDGLAKLHHKLVDDNPVVGFTAMAAISRVRGDIEAMFDPRRYGSVSIE